MLDWEQSAQCSWVHSEMMISRRGSEPGRGCPLIPTPGALLGRKTNKDWSWPGTLVTSRCLHSPILITPEWRMETSGVTYGPGSRTPGNLAGKYGQEVQAESTFQAPPRKLDYEQSSSLRALRNKTSKSLLYTRNVSMYILFTVDIQNSDSSCCRNLICSPVLYNGHCDDLLINTSGCNVLKSLYYEYLIILIFVSHRASDPPIVSANGEKSLPISYWYSIARVASKLTGWGCCVITALIGLMFMIPDRFHSFFHRSFPFVPMNSSTWKGHISFFFLFHTWQYLNVSYIHKLVFSSLFTSFLSVAFHSSSLQAYCIIVKD